MSDQPGKSGVDVDGGGEPRGPLFPIEDDELKRLACARSDVSAALQTCDLLLKSIESADADLYTALSSTIVICYARPFTRNEAAEARLEALFGHLPEMPGVRWDLL
jgi:hypothetical protein